MKKSTIQKQIVEFLSYHSRRVNFVFFSIPNEGFMSAAMSNKSNRNKLSKLSIEKMYAAINHLKKMGLVLGMPDLCVFKHNKIIFFKVKSETGELTRKQKMIHQWLRDSGAYVNTVRSIEDVQKILISLGVLI